MKGASSARRSDLIGSPLTVESQMHEFCWFDGYVGGMIHHDVAGVCDIDGQSNA
jgi:hypothetical protein